MPTYDYLCTKCGRVETRRNVSVEDRDQQACSCNYQMHRLLSAPAIFSFANPEGTCPPRKAE
jgi:putative FmdB family regulatory protein